MVELQPKKEENDLCQFEFGKCFDCVCVCEFCQCCLRDCISYLIVSLVCEYGL